MLSDNSYLLFHVVSQLKASPSSCELVRTPKSEVLWVEFLLLHSFHGELTQRVLQIYKSCLELRRWKKSGLYFLVVWYQQYTLKLYPPNIQSIAL